MIETVILIPSLLANVHTTKNEGEHLMRDAVLLGIVCALESLNIKFPRTVFVATGIFILASEILNNLTYRLLPPSEKLKNTWLKLQCRQFRKELIKFIELKNDYKHFEVSADNFDNVPDNNLRSLHI